MAHPLDVADPLAHIRDRFQISDPNLIYLDGNSLGRAPKAALEAVQRAAEHEWSDRLIRSWNESWIGLSTRLGGKLANLIGCAEDEALVCDSTSLNLYKLAMAAMRSKPERREMITDLTNFPSDLYILQGVAEQCGGTFRLAENPEQATQWMSDQTAVLCLSWVSFQSGAVPDVAGIQARANELGVQVIWDLSHAAGAVEIDLHGIGATMAVGCTYKYLNGGPGAPAYLYVHRDLQNELVQPVWGWFGSDRPFEFRPDYRPAEGIHRFGVGTPPVLSLTAVEAGLDLLLEASMAGVRAKSVALTERFIQFADERLAPFGFEVATPRDPAKRGSHVSLRHPFAYAIDQALIHEANVIPDFRSPDLVRFGFTPLDTRFADVDEAVDRLEAIMREERWRAYPNEPGGVT